MKKSFRLRWGPAFPVSPTAPAPPPTLLPRGPPRHHRLLAHVLASRFWPR
ncbi:hypothetical protein T02_13737 [Trichinella nativa]|uniref:Uncharacterized protein n=1 Tax=Trichinella nativa TaxID=6335 RepID=A0A0V1KH53_9BILA|nr:hypothetical protein T02_13737 [Trichinella nativa]